MSMDTAIYRGESIGKSIRIGKLKTIINQQNNTIERIAAERNLAQHDQHEYQEHMRLKKNNPNQALFEIFAEMRPDQFSKKADILDKQIYNLRLIAWAEWWHDAFNGQGMKAKAEMPIMRCLSEALDDGPLGIADTAAAARALEDMANRTQLALGLDDPRTWVKKRVQEMVDAKPQWKKDDPTVPVPGTLGKMGVAFELISKERNGEPVDPIGKDIYGIGDMVQR